MHEVLVNRLGGLSLPRKSVVRLTDRPDMTLDVDRGRKTRMQQQQQQPICKRFTKTTRISIFFLNQVSMISILDIYLRVAIFYLVTSSLAYV